MGKVKLILMILISLLITSNSMAITQVNNISELIQLGTTNDNVYVLGYHEPGDGGGGLFYWDSNEPKTNHNGGTIIDPDVTFPSNWNDTLQQEDWFSGGNTGNGCWKRIFNGDINVKWFGAKGDNNTDDTNSIKYASNFAKVSTGKLFFPAGIYHITSQVEIPAGVVWLGVRSEYVPQYNVDHWDTSNVGSVLAIKFGAGSTDIYDSAIILNSYSTLDGFGIWYPDQPGSTSSPVIYPPAIALNPAGDPNEYNNRIVEPSIRNCILVNPYIGINATVEHEMLTLENIRYTAWKKGIIIDKSYDIDRLINIHSNPTISYRGAWPSNHILKYHISDDSTASITIGKADQIYLDKIFSYGFYIGLNLVDISGSGVNTIIVQESGFEGCGICIRAYGNFNGLRFEGCTFGNSSEFGTNNCIEITKDQLDDIVDEIKFINCYIWQSTRVAFFIWRVSNVVIDGVTISNACSVSPGYEISALEFGNCKNVMVSNTRVALSPNNNNCVYYSIFGSDLVFLRDCQFSNYTSTKNTTSAVISNGSSHIRVIRPAYTNSSAGTNIWVSGDCTDVVISDKIIY